MKIALSFLFLLCSFSLSAQLSKDIADKRTQYYKTGMVASVAHYDSVLKQLEQQRYANTLSESEFLKANRICENQYKAQQNVLTEIAELWAISPSKKNSKNVRAALALVTNGNPKAAISELEAKLKDKKIKRPFDKVYMDYLFLAEANQFVGNNYAALATFRNLINKDASNVKLFQQYAELLSRVGQDSLALEYINKAIESSPKDTTVLIEAKILAASIYRNGQSFTEAQSSLIEAQYLVETFVSNKIDLSGIEHHSWLQWVKETYLPKILNELAFIQQLQNNFDLALRNSKRCIDILEHTDDKIELAKAYTTLALIYKRAGANKEADTLYRKAIIQYEWLAKNYPIRYNSILADVLIEYAAVHKWFDRNDEYEKTLRRSAELRQQMMFTNYPFFAVSYAQNVYEIGQKKMNIDAKIYLAETEWKEARDVLEPINKRLPMIAGNELSNALYKVGSVKLALDSALDGKPAFARALQVREYLYRLAPSENKSALMRVLFHNATLNAINNGNKELSIEQLSRAKILADDLGEAKFGADIQRLKLEVLKR